MVEDLSVRDLHVIAREDGEVVGVDSEHDRSTCEFNYA